MSLQEAKQFLMKDAGNGSNLFEHLSEVLLKVLVERPSDACESFEHISAAVRQAAFAAQAAGKGEGADLSFEEKEAMDAAKAEQLRWSQQSTQLFQSAADTPQAPVQDLLDEANMFEWAGVSFGREETFRLFLSMRQLAAAQGVERLRLWGKILGQQGDYYVCEAQLGTPCDPTDPTKMEGREGANKYTYFVCSQVGGAWEQLPEVTQEQIVQARKLKRFFSGDLNAPVRGYPPFPGTEKNLLRAQIARITAGTVVCPTEFFIPDEEEPLVIVPNQPEDIPERTTEELASLEQWCHAELELNAYGRCTAMPEQLDEDGEPVEDENAPEQVPALRELPEDDEGIWTQRLFPVTGSPMAGSLVVMRNLVWPGAHTVGFGKRYANVYVGYGFRRTDKPYAPPLPPPVQAEFVVEEDGEIPPLDEEEDVVVDPAPPADDDDV